MIQIFECVLVSSGWIRSVLGKTFRRNPNVIQVAQYHITRSIERAAELEERLSKACACM